MTTCISLCLYIVREYGGDEEEHEAVYERQQPGCTNPLRVPAGEGRGQDSASRQYARDSPKETDVAAAH